MQTVIAHVNEEPPPVSACTELDVPAAFESIVMDCLRKDPEQRPRTAGELAKRLERCGWESGWSAERADAWWAKHSPPPAANGEGSGGKERPATPSRAKR